MHVTRRFALFAALLSAVAIASAQNEISATYQHHALSISVPFHGLRSGTHTTCELLSPEDDVLGQTEHGMQATNADHSHSDWQAKLTPPHALDYDDLVWERLRCILFYADEHTPSFTETRSLSTILRRPVVRLLGQTSFLADSAAALRVLVTDGQTEPLTTGTVRIDLLAKDTAPRLLFSGKLDHRGTVDAQFHFPAGLTGDASLRIRTETPIGSAETTQTVHLEDKVSILLTTEKPLYQPSQTIHVRALALDRADHHAAANRKLTFEIEDARGNKVFRKATETDSFGVASTEFTLADEVNLGSWHLHALLASTDDAKPTNSAELTLEVKRYVLPKFRVAIDLTAKDGKPQRDFRPGDHVTGTVDAKYFFGKPVADAEIEIEATGMDVSTFEAAKSTGRTDDSGKYHFDLTLPSYFAGRSTSHGSAPVLLEASVKDTSGHTETRGEPITITASALLIQAVPEGGQLIPGLDNVVYVMTSYPDGTPAATTVRLHTKGSQLTPIETGRNGIGIVHLTGSSANEQLRAEADDHHGKRTATTLRLTSRSGEDQVLLRTDHAVYRPGDSMRVDVLSTKQSGAAYIDLIKDGQTILTRDVDLASGHAELAIPTTPALSGTVEINAYLFGADSRPIRDHRLLFIQPAEDLHIEATADLASYLPGSEAHVHFQVTDAHGKGVEAALGLEVVDEAVFALAEKQPGFANVFFYLEQELLKPRFEIHSVTPTLINGSPNDADLEESAARVLFSAAESVQPHTLDTTFGREVPTASRDAFTARYQGVFLEQATRLASQLRGTSNRRNIPTAFATLHPNDAWDTPLQIAATYWNGDNRYYRITSAGPDCQFGTNDDLTATIDVVEGALQNRGNSGTISLKLEHDHGPVNGLAAITGSLFDQSGAVIPGAKITLQNLGTSVIRHTHSDPGGSYTLTALQPGHYRITIDSRGFNSTSRTIDIAPRDQAILTATLSVGSVNESVEINAAAAMLATDSIEALPAVGRAFAPMGGPMAQTTSLNGHGVDLLSDAGRTAAKAAPTTQTADHTRSYFPEALLIAPEIITDSHGAASITIPMADSITIWRMAMFASTKSGALGSASSSLKVFQDFFVDLDLPVTITQGDRISIPVAVYNYAGKPGTVELHLAPADWFDLANDTADKTVAISADQVGSSQFTIVAKHSGSFKLALSARMGDRHDTIVRDIEITPNGQPLDTVFNGSLDSGDSTVTHSINAATNALPEARKLFVRLYPGPLSQVIEGMDGILRMPYGCFEQTSSSTYPNVLALDYMKRTGKLTPEIHAKAEGFIATGYQRLLTFEVPGGGFSWFGQAPANKILTAYGLMEFHDMSAVHDVDPQVIERTRNWLISQQQPDGSWKPDTQFINEGATNRFNTNLVRITAYIAWSLEASGYNGTALDKARAFLRARWNDSSTKLDAYTLAVLANFAVDGRTDAHDILNRLIAAAQHDDDQLWWSTEETSVYATGTSAAIETTGLAVQALLKSGEQTEASRKALAWLLSKKTGNGNWGSTQATIMALRALVMASEKAGSDALGTVEVRLNGEAFKTVELTKENNDLLQQLMLPAGSSDKVELLFHGSGGLAYQIDSRVFIPWPDHDAKEALSIDVAYDRTKLAENDLVTATATIHNNLPQKANMIMVDLGIPPGFELQTEDLQSMIEKTAHARSACLEKFSLTATQAILYFDSLEAGETTKVHFRLRAKYPVRAKTFESRVYEYYDPAVNSTARPAEFEVTAK